MVVTHTAWVLQNSSVAMEDEEWGAAHTIWEGIVNICCDNAEQYKLTSGDANKVVAEAGGAKLESSSQMIFCFSTRWKN